MIQGEYKILKNAPIAKAIYKMVLAGDTDCFRNAGQFVNIRLDGRYLRRPISVSAYDEATLTLLYKVVGGGTEQMSKMKQGETLNLLAGLGNGFSIVDTKKPMLIGGGIGAAPLYGLCQRLTAEDRKVTVILGAATKDDLFYVDEFRALGAEVIIATDDGSEGVHGFVTDAVSMMQATPADNQQPTTDNQQKLDDFDYVYCCGPTPMMKAVYRLCEEKGKSGQFSLEERMGCGFGACVGCSIETKDGHKRVCKDGPVFRKEVLLW